MPTNEQRRATAKRKLERQMERRATQDRRRQILTIVGAVVAVLVVAAAVTVAIVKNKRDSETKTASTTSTTTSTTPTAPGQLPAFAPPADLGADCQYPAADPASKPVNPPRTGKVPIDPPQVSASMATSQGNIGLQLDNAKAPCTVNSFASLAQQGFFDNTPCHRLTDAPTFGVLQCGDPTGEGAGGPGYRFSNEYPTNQFRPDDPALEQPVLYPRGTLAMANSGGFDSNGSQFFLVFRDSKLAPNYTVFGTIDQTGLATLDKIAAGGVAGGAPDGKPAVEVTVKSIKLD